MNTYRELIYICIDELKLLSDDAYYTEEHIAYLLDKYRLFLLKQRYSDIKKEIPQSNYQTIKVQVEKTEKVYGEPCENVSKSFYKSIEQLPYLSTLCHPRIYKDSYFMGEISYVSRDRMRYIGYNKYLKNIIYGTIAPDRHLYLTTPLEKECTNKENEICSLPINEVYIVGIFESEESYYNNDLSSTTFPIEDALIPPLIELVVRDLSQAVYRPDDNDNNSKDDLSEINIKQPQQ